MHQLHQYLPQLYVFKRVVELGSFQAAANELDLPRSSISKKVSQLEAALSQRLLQAIAINRRGRRFARRCCSA